MTKHPQADVTAEIMDQLPDRQALEDNSQKKDKWWKNKSLKEQEMVSDSFKIPVLKINITTFGSISQERLLWLTMRNEE